MYLEEKKILKKDSEGWGKNKFESLLSASILHLFLILKRKHLRGILRFSICYHQFTLINPFS